MANDESWDAKKQEVWKRIVEVEGAILDLESQLTNVEEIAKNKVSENEENAMSAAKTASESVAIITKLLEQTKPLQTELETAKQTLSEIASDGATIKKQAEETAINAGSVADAKVTSETTTKFITDCQEKAVKLIEDTETECTKAFQQAQNITDLETEVKQKTETALKTANDSITKITEFLKNTESLQAPLETARKTISEINENGEAVKAKNSEVIAQAKTISEAKINAETILKEITVCQERATKAQEDANTKWATVTQQVQNIKNLEADAKQNAATAKASRENIEKLQTEITQLKTDFSEVKNTWLQTFSNTNKENDDKLRALYASKDSELKRIIADNTALLKALNDKYSDEFKKRVAEIESLLPGATSAGLASAFAERKQAIEKNKIWWAVLLIISAVALIIFGIFSLTPWGSSMGVASSIPGRTVIIAGLILLEEFARRNFNIISRLAESYAYKEALAKSYFGYKKQMEEISMPSTNVDADVKGHSVLMKTFLDKLEDEPGKHVFDKEKQLIGIGGAIEQLSPNNPDGAAGKAVDELSKGRLLTKINWPIVAIVAILAIAGCVIAYLLK